MCRKIKFKLGYLKFYLSLIVGFANYYTFGQADSTSYYSIYKVNIKVEAPLTIAGLVGTSLAFPALYKASNMSTSEITLLNRNDINSFDRSDINMNESKYDLFAKKSDRILNTTVLAPFLLLVDKNIRSEWANFVTLYTETQAINTFIYQVTAFSIRRPRPLT